MVIKYVNDYLVNLILRTHEILFGGKTRMSYFMFLYREFYVSVLERLFHLGKYRDGKSG